MEQSKFPAAAEILKPLASLHCDARVVLLLAAALEGSGELPSAEAALEQAHAFWPTDNRIAVSLAREYLGSGQTAAAARALDHFHASARSSSQELQMAALVFLANHQLTAAESAARIGYTSYPSISTLLLLANSLQLEGRYKDVIALLAAKRGTYKTSAAFLVTLGQSEFDAAMYDPSRQDVELAITLQHDLYAAHYLLGNILLKQGDPQAAVAEYRVATELSPDQPRTYYYLALALRAEHREEEEEDVLAKAIELDNHYALAHCEMGRILLNQNRLADAVDQLKLAIADNGSSEQAYYLLSRAYNRTGDTEKADATAKRLAEVRAANHRPATSSSMTEGLDHQQATP